ncbi:MAG: hypothetical protein KC684_02485 [Candidatus Omnitrophica bacterium]|nr:hypothetical protein [Candidatus Omnitrophota bacterium]
MVSQKDKKEILELVNKQVNENLTKKVSLLATLLIILNILGLVTTYGKIKEIVINRIAEQFKEERIRKTLQTVASDKANDIMENILNPQIDGVKEEIISFENYMNNMRLSFSNEYKTLAKEVEILKARNALLLLTDKAITQGDRSAYDKVQNIYRNSKDAEVSSIARAEMLKIKAFYASTNRIKSGDVIFIDEEGRSFKNGNIPTDILLKYLIGHKEVITRAKSADLLRNRKEKDVPETLIESFKNEKNLIVLKNSIQAFERVTGYENSDVFDYEKAIKWWENNRDEYYKKIIPSER